MVQSTDHAMSNQGWIGVDLDGTLAHHEGYKAGHIGEPIWPMVERIKGWLAEGKQVKIVTARVHYVEGSSSHGARDAHEAAVAILKWLRDEAGLPMLPVQAHKDFQMVELWDDRAVRVKKNTGERCCDV